MKNLGFGLAIGAVCLFLFSCSSPPYPGFKATPSGIFYKLHFIGDGKVRARKGDYVKFSRKLYDRNVSNSMAIQDTTIQLDEQGYLLECFSLLAEGDSASFFIDSNRFDLKIHKIFSPEQHRKEQEYISWKNDGEMNELKKLKEYLIKNNIDNSFLNDGIYFIPVKKGKGNIVEIGNTVVVHYKGSFPDSLVFDDTYEKKQPLEFKFGDDDQVLRGIELAICQMRKGEKAKIIIPSHLAFGETGSSTGIVPPFTTVEYELEIVNLK